MKTILIVDDEPNVRMAIEATLEKFGHQLLFAEHGKDGLDQFNTHDPDIVITDLVMPVMSGIDLIYAIRMIDRDRPVIAISGGGGGAAAVDILEEAVYAGANLALQKPFQTEEMREAVSRMLSGRPVVEVLTP